MAEHPKEGYKMTEIMQIEQSCKSENLAAGTAEEGQSPAGPMVLTVGQGGPPILKLVSPVDGGAPQLIKVVPAVVSSDGAPQNDEKGPEGLVSQRVYSIVQKPPQKQGFNNGQQRLHTIGALPHKSTGPQKVQILSNVILSNKNLVNVKNPLQRQIRTLGPQGKAGVKTLGPLKMVPAQRGIKTLAPRPKPNYIGKHAAQALRPRRAPKTPPEDLGEDIGEEVKPDFSPNLSYLYQVVMLDHNYGAPPPATSPPRAPVHQSPGGLNGALSSRDSGGKRRLNSGGNDDDAASTISSEGGAPDDGDEGEETETAPEGEGDEDGITRCICDFDHDDGYMICCDVCSSWQHVDCMGLDRDHIPDKYSCVRCAPRRVDRAHARALQQRKREEFARLGPPAGLAQPQTQTEPPNREDSSSDEDSDEKSVLNNNLPKKRSAPVTSGGRRRSEPARRAPLPPRRPPRRESAPARRTTLKKKERKAIVKRKLKPRSSVDESSQEAWGAPQGPATPSGLSQLRQWIDKYEEAVTNHYSPELRARMSRASAALEAAREAPGTAAEDARAPRCRVANGPARMLLATTVLQPGSPVVELRGKYMLGAQHRASAPPTRLAQRPQPFLFFYRLQCAEVCVDTRTYGNDARFIRRSCRPNAELRHLLEKGALHLYVVTTQTVQRDQELTLPGPGGVSCACGGPCRPEEPQEEVTKVQQPRSPSPPPPPVSAPSPEPPGAPAASSSPSPPSGKKRKLTREERKMEAIMKAFERLEKAEQRKQEVQARQAQRPEPPGAPAPPAALALGPPRRRRRKGRTPRTSRRLRLNSTDSGSGEGGDAGDGGEEPEAAAGLLLALAGGQGPAGEPGEQSSPETPLSSACLLVAAAVGPLEPGFKFPKTHKKVLMNEWLHKEEGLHTLVAAAGLCEGPRPQGGTSAKKRWLRQAIEECESPPAGPPKKRRLARESLSSEQGFTPPSTPTGPAALGPDHDEEFYPPELPRPSPLFRDSAQLLGTVEKSIRFYEESLGGAPALAEDPEPSEEEDEPLSPNPQPPEPPEPEPLEPPEPERETTPVPRTPTPEPEIEPQTPEKTQHKPEIITPAKRKLSISEYRKRKQLNKPDKTSSPPPERPGTPESPPLANSPTTSSLIGSGVARRSRSASSSSATSSLSSDEDILIGPPVTIETSTDINKSERPIVETAVTVAFNSAPTAVERQRENVERLKKVFGLSVDDESRKNIPIQKAQKVCMAEKVCGVKAERAPSPPKAFSPEEPSFIPPFNNPVYPNSAQFPGGFSSVIDSALYEGRNPSPPPPELLPGPQCN